MQRALPLLAQWDASVLDTDRVTHFAAPPTSSPPYGITCMDRLMNEMVGS